MKVVVWEREGGTEEGEEKLHHEEDPVYRGIGGCKSSNQGTRNVGRV